MSKKIRKLTPTMLKRIIKEEKQMLSKKSSKKYSKRKKQIKILKETKKMQLELVLKFKKLYQLRNKIKNNLIKKV